MIQSGSWFVFYFGGQGLAWEHLATRRVVTIATHYSTVTALDTPYEHLSALSKHRISRKRDTFFPFSAANPRGGEMSSRSCFPLSANPSRQLFTITCSFLQSVGQGDVISLVVYRFLSLFVPVPSSLFILCRLRTHLYYHSILHTLSTSSWLLQPVSQMVKERPTPRNPQSSSASHRFPLLHKFTKARANLQPQSQPRFLQLLWRGWSHRRVLPTL